MDLVMLAPPRSALASILMVIRIGRLLECRWWILLELFHDHLHGLFELCVVALAPCGRLEFDVDVGSDADVLDLPLAFQPVERPTRRHYRAAVDQVRIP